MFVKQILVALSVSCFSLACLVPPASADSAGGESVSVHRVDAFTTVTFKITCFGGLPQVVIVEGDGDTDLDLEVYDQYGNLVVWDRDPTDVCVVRWFPSRTQTYTVKIRNMGSVYNVYTLAVN